MDRSDADTAGICEVIMTVDIVLAMPLSLQSLQVLTLLVLATGLVFAIELRKAHYAILLFLMLFCSFWIIVIQPVIISAIPLLSPVWQDATYTVTHPETWFNFTVVWPK